MIMLRYSLASAGLVGLISGALSNPAYASDTAMQNPLAIERSAGTTVFAEKDKTQKGTSEQCDPERLRSRCVLYPRQSRDGNPLIKSTYNARRNRLKILY
jgi:hypothetical protein